MSDYRRIFPSYCWDEDVWRVNQMVQLPNIVGKENIGFVKGVPNEEINQSDRAIAQWIDTQMQNCSCVIVFVGEETYKSEWVLYEIKKARELGKARFIINLEGMKDRFGIKSRGGIDPYAHHGLYLTSGLGYTINHYSWIKDDGLSNISYWIEEAIARRG